MARKRYISTEISVDSRINTLAREYGDFAVLLYTWLIPHAGDDGALTGNPEEIAMIVIPGFRHHSVSDITEALSGMHELKLIFWDKENERIYFDSDTFYKYQPYVSLSKRRSSNPWEQKTAEEETKENKTAVIENYKREMAENGDNKRLLTENPASPSPSPSPSPTKEQRREEHGAAGSAPLCPFEKIKEIWNEVMGPRGRPEAGILTAKRKKLLKAIWNTPGWSDVGVWREFFEYVAQSDFLMARFPGLTFDWVIRQENWVKIREGNYHDGG